MNCIKFSTLALIVMSGSAFSVEPASSAPIKSGTAQPKTNVQRPPVVGSMLEDGREVPARFQGVESKEQKARRENQEQKQSSSEKD